MLNYVLDDGCLFEKIKNALDSKISSDDVLDYSHKIDDLRIYIANDLDCKVFINDDYASNKINDKFIYDHLSSPDDVSLRDSFLSLYVNLDRLSKYEPEDHIVDEVFTDDEFCASSFINNLFSGLITERDVNSKSWWNAKINMVTNTCADALLWYKNKFIVDGNPYSAAYDLRKVFWPNCYFYPLTTDKFSNLSVPEREYLKLLFTHLDFLDNYAQSYFIEEPLNHVFIQKAGSYGVDMSPESTLTHNNVNAMNLRKVNVGGLDITCEWHTKLTVTKGRVHFNLNINEPEKIKDITKGKVIVGIFTKHFDT